MTIIPPEVIAHYEDMIAHLCVAAAVKAERRNPARVAAETVRELAELRKATLVKIMAETAAREVAQE